MKTLKFNCNYFKLSKRNKGSCENMHHLDMYIYEVHA